MVLHRLYMQQIILFTSVYQDMEQGEVSFCIDSYTPLNQHESGDKPLPNNFQNSNGVAPIVASGLRQSSLRGYDKCRFGVTTNAASGLRQTLLQNIGKHGCLLMSGMPIF
ncbi:hypothetical protein HMPREF1173_02275 [Prevotella nigrescens CC14M]|uniref:Uncharacterized protein n=2 Tax=Prevotella nigrescens TaxID=28133 RepID=V8CFX2_9BACT|nr:hypothetical protein HMPREF1173_02275 [Prevotella nigrescens CC14M]